MRDVDLARHQLYTPQPPNTLVDITIAEAVEVETDIDLEGNEDNDDFIRERGSVLYLGMALECWDFAKLAIA